MVVVVWKRLESEMRCKQLGFPYQGSSQKKGKKLKEGGGCLRSLWFSDHIKAILPQKGVGPLSRFGCRSLHIDAGKDFSVNVVVHLVFIQDNFCNLLEVDRIKI